MPTDPITSESKIRVLAVDDSPAVLAYISTLLVPERFIFTGVGSAEEAQEKLAGGTFEIMLLDLELPGMSGMELLASLRQAGSDLAIVILTSKGSVPVALEAMRRGADGFIQKQESFAGEIEHLLERAREHRDSVRMKEQLNRLRSDFYAAITHDLRSPIGSALMALSLLEEGVGGPSGAHEMKRIMRSSLERAMGLIDRYLDYERIDDGLLKLNPAPADLVALARSVVRDLSVQAMGRNQTLKFQPEEGELTFSFDAERLAHVVQNLVSNALRYTMQGGRIEVSTELKDGKALLHVKDNGVGIPPEDHDRIFQKFYRSKSGVGVGGAGLGLLIAREIVEGHGGKITVKSSGVAGEGSHFTVALPAG